MTLFLLSNISHKSLLSSCTIKSDHFFAIFTDTLEGSISSIARKTLEFEIIMSFFTTVMSSEVDSMVIPDNNDDG